MAKRGRKSHNVKGKAYPIPHNNRKQTNGRKVRKQLIVMDKPDETGNKKKTIFHYDYSPYEQGRIHLIKKALSDDDSDILKKLSPAERKLYDTLLKIKEAKEKDGNEN